jgi:hypothetical protein
MKKIILTFGLVSGVVLSAMMVLTLPLHDRIDNETGMVIGYTTMVAASIAIYFGVRRYRDEIAGGSVSFGRAFLVGAAIACVSSACYTATWEVIYYNFKSDYLTTYQARELEKERARGATPAELAKKQAEFAAFAKLYANPVVNSAFTFLEPLPVGLLVALVSAGMLRRRRSGAADGLVGQAAAGPYTTA